MFFCCSPFWKLTTECGTKQPCLEQAVAPIPVDCSFCRLALACEMAL